MSPALKLLHAARLLLAAHPLKEEKIIALLGKIRKGAGTYKGAELEQVLTYLGGWTIQEVPMWVPRGKSKKTYWTADEPVWFSSPNKNTAEATYQEKKSEEVKELPDPASYTQYATVTMDVEPLKEVSTSSGTAFGFQYREWQRNTGLEITSPDGQVFRSYAGLQSFRIAYPDNFNGTDKYLKRWLIEDTGFLRQVSDKLGLPTLEEEKEEKILLKKIPTKENTATCPCCFGVFKLTPKARFGSDKSLPGMTLHGYKRPGTGFLHGNCFGESWPPYELSKEGTEAFLVAVQQKLEDTQGRLERLNKGEVEYLFDTAKNKRVSKSDTDPKQWEELVGMQRYSYESDIKGFEKLIPLLEKAIKDWSPKPLPVMEKKATKDQEPSKADQKDALEHASESTGTSFSLDNFKLSYLGLLKVSDLYQFDDIDSWLDFHAEDFRTMRVEERLEELESFRGAGWAKRARSWLQTGIPPVIVVTVQTEDGESTMIGDGRGRINFASLMDLPLPVWSMVQTTRTKEYTEAIGMKSYQAALSLLRIARQVVGGIEEFRVGNSTMVLSRKAFDLQEFERLVQEGNEDGTDPETRLQTANWYARQNLQRLGAGAARNVYAIDDKTVLKVAQDVRGGLRQNLIEAALSQWGSSIAPITRVHAHEPEGVWLIADRATPMKSEDELVQHVGFDSADLRMQLKTMLQEKPKRSECSPLLWGLYELVKTGGLDVDDVVRPYHWGLNGSGKPVLFDYGLT